MIPQHVDWSGIATLIGALGSFAGVMVGIYIQIMNWRDNRRIRLEQDTHKELLCAIKGDTTEIRKVDTAP